MKKRIFSALILGMVPLFFLFYVPINPVLAAGPPMFGGGSGGGAIDMGAWGSATEVTISEGVATLDGEGYYTIDTQGDAASDDLTELSGLSVGDEVVLKPEDGARTVVVKHGTHLKLQAEADFTMNNENDVIKLQCTAAGVCRELTRVNAGD